ncbi:MAG: hypothetical protein FJW19_06985 [Actinobacteria bacterium]|nr:hypothetical protein [Actinomycetota bacterium]
MKRKTLDITMSVGGILIAALAIVLGFVFQANADFATTYVRDQLSEQKIMFPVVEYLSEQEATVPCLVEFAGTSLDNGKKSECYANEYIGSHLKGIGGGETYATLGTPQRELQAKVADAKKANDPNLATLEADLAKVSGQRDSMFKGETLRGLLLTTYGFSVLGEKAAWAATIAFFAAAILVLASIAGFAHAFATPKDQKI